MRGFGNLAFTVRAKSVYEKLIPALVINIEGKTGIGLTVLRISVITDLRITMSTTPITIRLKKKLETV
jgi:hypothetical protein